MGRNFLNIWLQLLCALAIIAGVHSQSEAIYHQPFEADAVHSIMRSWINAGTQASLLTGEGLNESTPNWGWSFNEHPCYYNQTRNSTSWSGTSWKYIECTFRSYETENNKSVLNSSLTGIQARLSYSSTRLIGQLPNAILNLTNLETLSISNAIKLTGPLPPGIFCYNNVLTTMTLKNCSLSGGLSDGFSGCNPYYNRLEILDLSSNFFTGGTIFLQHFTYLKYLDLSSNSFTGGINVLENFIHLEYLDLSMNYFTEGFNGRELFSNLKYLNVSNNLLNGEYYVGGSQIETVDLSNNSLTNISFYIDESVSFKSIDVEQNSLIRFPEELFYSKTLQDINLDFNNISSISQNSSKYVIQFKVSNLQKITMRKNLFQTFPGELLQFQNLKEIYLDFNNISSISHSSSNYVDYFNVSTMQKISMRNNLFQKFPGELLQFQNLEEINLDSNNISGVLNLPNISCQYSSIKLISLLYNKITAFNPSNDMASCFSATNLLSNDKLFLGGNPICNDGQQKTKLLRRVCRFNKYSKIEAEELRYVEKSNKILIIIFSSTSPMAFVALIITFFIIRKLRKKISLLHEIQNEFDKRDMKPNLYSFSELRVATQDFHIDNELGRGGFGKVYKGILPDGSTVAVKKLTKLSVEQGIQDFLNEIIAISNVKHRNLVQLKGCCIKENQRILVYEYVENNSLANALWGGSNKYECLDWPTRFNIIMGIARGLSYLHEEVQPAIIHRDIKCSNILLDKDLNSKIADFGLALFFPSLDDGETHMSVSKVCGTMGYMAPEYVCYNQVSTKLDVYSFGVLLLEIVTGRKNLDLKLSCTQRYLVQWALEMHSTNNLLNLKDKSLKEMSLQEDASFKQVVEIALQCLQHFAARRPTMSEVVAMLIGNKKVDQYVFEKDHRGSNTSYDVSTSYDVGTSGCNLTTTDSFLQHIVEKDGNLHSDIDSLEQSSQLSEIALISKEKI